MLYFGKVMIVTSTFFKRDFDVSKAELIGEGNFAQVSNNAIEGVPGVRSRSWRFPGDS